MRISGNFTDRLIYRALPTGLILGLLSAAISNDHLLMNLILTIVLVVVVCLVDFWFIQQDLGAKLNRIDIKDRLYFNEKGITPKDIVKIETKNIYPNSLKWSITKVMFQLADGTTFQVLAKPHSILFLASFFMNMFTSYLQNRKQQKAAGLPTHVPLSSYINKETNKTLTLLFAKYPELRKVRR